MISRWRVAIYGVATLLVLAAGFAGGRGCERSRSRLLLQSALRASASVHQLLATTKVEQESLEGLLTSKDTRIQALIAELALANGRPERTREVIQWRTRVEPGSVEVIGCSPGLAVLENGVVVAEFDGETLSALGLFHRGAIVLSDNKATASIEMASDYDPAKWAEIPIELEVQALREHKIFEPHLALGLTGSLEPSPVGGAASASLLMTFIHPHEDWDVLGARISVASDSVRGGVDIIGGNLGRPLPLVDDLWIYGGASLGVRFNEPLVRPVWSIDLTLATKF